MQLSTWGHQMSRPSGIRSLMEDIATTAGSSGDGTGANLSVGNPSPIPEVLETWQRLSAAALATDFPESGGHYGPSRGTHSLVDAVVRYFNAAYGWSIGPENVVVGPGSQMLCFVATTLFTGPTGPTGPAGSGHRPLVLPCVPDYTGYQGLNLVGSATVGVGATVVPHGERSFRYALDADALQQVPDMGMMLVSSPGNPTGRSLTAAELDTLIDTVERHDALLVVDHAYGRPFPMLTGDALDPVHHPRVINCFTLSKAGLPGERIAFAIGPADAVSAMVSFMANTVLHAPQTIQAVVERALDSGELDVLTQKVISPYYRDKRQAAEALLHSLLPDDVDWRLHEGDGGMFCWLWIDHEWFDDLDFYRLLKEEGVFIVPGRHFFGTAGVPGLPGHATRCFRLSLSGELPDLERGFKRIGALLTLLRDRSHEADPV
ncbi:aminotransferase class I/II-fold pyridoxal phosphate-dependent enzyme [Streptomyces sp. NPDC002928]|uniref:aminotransferase class I/II-fold pyridoxal phosphate-dependent enzyme n=1 Tax=Streptomyces sp. NPDC002928 TaxID=3154440 RepID=UPI0033A5DB60